MKVSQLKVNPSNPRVITRLDIKEALQSIEAFPEMMEKRPMVCVTDIDGKIMPIGGNARLLAIKKSNRIEIPDSWIVMADEWSEDQRKEFIIKDNINYGKWDVDILDGWDDRIKDWGLIIGKSPNNTKEADSLFTNDNCAYPLVPTFDEKYSFYIIICKTETEEAGIRTLFKYPEKSKSYKGEYYGKSNIVEAKDIL